MQKQRRETNDLKAGKTDARGAWFTSLRPNPQAALRLFCFPYAGGGAVVFRDWAKSLPSNVEVSAAQLPGRGPRLMETPFTNMPALADALSEAIVSQLDKPFVFFGHSMGATASFEVARRLRKMRKAEPLHLFVSGADAPQVVDAGPMVHALPDKEFIKKLRELNGTPPEILENEDLMELMLPTLRADFAIAETYAYTRDKPLNCPITAFGGLHDKEVSRKSMEGWSEQTNAAFSLRMFPGDHFFLHNAQPLLQILSRELHRLSLTL